MKMHSLRVNVFLECIDTLFSGNYLWYWFTWKISLRDRHFLVPADIRLLIYTRRYKNEYRSLMSTKRKRVPLVSSIRFSLMR